jgi:hypothetical protein
VKLKELFGSDRLGFEVVDISNAVYRNLKWFSCLPINILSSPAPLNMNIFNHPAPSYLFMSKDKLTKLYKK